MKIWGKTTSNVELHGFVLCTTGLDFSISARPLKAVTYLNIMYKEQPFTVKCYANLTRIRLYNDKITRPSPPYQYREIIENISKFFFAILM